MVRFVAILLLVATLWFAWALAIPVAPPVPQVLLFPSGSSSRSIAAELQRAGVLRSRFAFELLHYAMPTKKLKAGEYRFVGAASGMEVFDRIARGDVLVHTVVVPEGYNMFEIAAAIEAAGLGKKEDFLAVATHDTGMIRAIDPQAKSLEGYLFPDTYLFSRTMTMHDMAAAMVKRFQRETQTMGVAQDAHRIVTLASIVEKETAAPDERPEVASVYINRLAKNMALAADPTVVYAALLNGTYRGTIYQSDLQSDSPYNTYKFAGLPQDRLRILVLLPCAPSCSRQKRTTFSSSQSGMVADGITSPPTSISTNAT